ncbi:unnamed protein product [Brachionus calyciflorus]|uniref:Uncharacterized protein n=1 Tax=Brachionus calyciflorus TaxID=104777 RepID=A0A814DPX3_9BILA|nr:unnamed protein product [Brachionus calyciflorus]
MNFKLAALALVLCVFQLACASGYNQGYGYGDKKDAYGPAPSYHGREAAYGKGHGYGHKTHYGKPEKVWVQNINDNKNKNEDETSSENESKNENININELLALIEKLRKGDGYHGSQYSHY